MMFQFLRTLFLPETVHGRPLLATRRTAIHIESHLIQVAHVLVTQRKTIINALEEYQVNPGDARTYHQRLTTTLKKIAPKINKEAEVIVTFPSAKVVVKELTLPFLDEEKIRMVIDYEIESAIPFKIENAVIDFIILRQSLVKESSTILVVAAQKEEVKKLLDIFQKADIQPQRITLDLFANSSLFSLIPAYSKLKHAYVMVDIGARSTRLLLVNNQAIVATRTISKGIEAAENNGSADEQGTKPETNQQKLFEEIRFTLNSFELKQANLPDIEKVFLITQSAVSASFQEFAEKQIHIPCELFATEQIVSAPLMKTALSHAPEVWQEYTRVLGAALLTTVYEPFTLRRKELAFSWTFLIKQQLIATVALCAFFISIISFQGYNHIKAGSEQIKMLENREIQRLKNTLPSDSPGAKKKTVKALTKEVESYVEEQEELWAAFSEQRLRPLEVLQELCVLFNKKKFDLDIEQVVIAAHAEQNPIEVKGVFRSKTNPGREDFKHFTELANDLRTSKTLMLTEEVDPTQLPEGKGVSFIAHFKMREGVQ